MVLYNFLQKKPNLEVLMLTIGELARRLGVSADTLKRWEENGKIPKPRRTIGGWRIYSEDEVKRIERMLGCQSAVGQKYE